MWRPGMKVWWGVLFGALAVSCASTKVTDTWKDPGAAATTRLDKVLVVAVVPQETLRRNLEEAVAAELRADGIQAVPSNRIIQDGSTLSRERVKQVVGQQDFDSVLLTQYQGTETSFDYVPGSYYDYYGFQGPMMYHPGYVDETTTVKFESRLYDATSGGRMVWSAATSTMDPSNAQKEAPKVANAIANQLEKDVGL